MFLLTTLSLKGMHSSVTTDSTIHHGVLRGQIDITNPILKEQMQKQGFVVVTNKNITQIYGEDKPSESGMFFIQHLPEETNLLVHYLFRNRVWNTSSIVIDSIASLNITPAGKRHPASIGKSSAKLYGNDGFITIPVTSLLSHYQDVYMRHRSNHADEILLQKIHYMRFSGKWHPDNSGNHSYMFYKDGTATLDNGRTVYWRSDYSPMRYKTGYALKAGEAYKLNIQISENRNFLKREEWIATIRNNDGEYTASISVPEENRLFIMKKENPYGTLTGTFFDERDGREYRWVSIGDQIWMAENLDVGIMVDSRAIHEPNFIIEKYCLENRQSSCEEYGGLYQWNETMNYVVEEKAQGICPAGWSIPSLDDWQQLADNLESKNVAGGKLKSTRTVPNVHPRWAKPNLLDEVDAGFNALPGGNRTLTGNLTETYTTGYWWTSTEDDEEDAIAIFIFNNNIILDHSTMKKEFGLSVRCIKD